jgi:hypothetical protein
VGPRAGLDHMENGKYLTLHGLELRPLSRPDRSLSLCRLSYRDSEDNVKTDLNEIAWENVGWIQLALDRKQRMAVLNTGSTKY